MRPFKWFISQILGRILIEHKDSKCTSENNLYFDTMFFIKLRNTSSVMNVSLWGPGRGRGIVLISEHSKNIKKN